MFSRQPRRPVATHCAFCEQDKEPDYKDYKFLRGFLSEKGKIQARSRTGVCMLHQRRLTRAIKQARYMALLPFVSIAR